MNEQSPLERQGQEHPTLDDRLSAYYGPALREQPLPPSVWQRVYSQLGSQRSAQRRLKWRWPWRGRRYAARRSVPAFIESAFMRITYEARLPRASSMLSCSIKAHVRQPQVRIIPLGKRNIRLKLPVMATISLQPAELDVLLATGLAHYLCTRKPSYAVRRLLLYSSMPLTWIILIMLRLHDILHSAFPIAIILCTVLSSAILWLLHIQRRRMALQADRLMVLWLGRGRACQGLHELAERSHRPLRRSWGELSLAERIGHVCGTQVPIEHERLTLVR